MYRRHARGRVLLLVFLALAIVVITLDFRQEPGGPLKRAKDLAVTVVAPIQRGFTAVTRPVGDFFSSLSNLSDLRGENERLKRQLDVLESQASEASPLEDENSTLREELDLEKRWTDMRPVTASVIGNAPSNYKWAVEIGKGRADGIKPGMAALDLDGLVGRVIQSANNTAVVLLLIDPDAGAGARIEGSEITGAVRGNGGSEALTMRFVSPEASVVIGDSVATSSYNRGVFPPGIPIGTVSNVSGQQAAVEAHIDVEPAVDFTSLDYLTILLDTGPKKIPKGK